MIDLTHGITTYINDISPVGEILLATYVFGITTAFCLLIFFIVRAINDKSYYIVFALIVVGLVGYTTYSLIVNLMNNSREINSPYIVQIIPELLLLLMLYNSYKKVSSGNNNYNKRNNNS